MAKFKVVKLENGGVKLYQDGLQIKDITSLDIRHHAIPGGKVLTKMTLEITSTNVEVVNENSGLIATIKVDTDEIVEEVIKTINKESKRAVIKA